MVIFSKNFIRIALVILAVVSTCLIIKYTQHQATTGSTPASAEHFHQSLAAQEDAAWDLMATTTGITKEQCQQKVSQQSKTYKHSIKNNQRKKHTELPALKQETIHLVHAILLDFNIDPKTVDIAPIRGLGGSAAAADDYTIYINEKEFCRFTPEACKFCIAHEIQHLKNRDHSTLQALASLTKTAKCTCEQKNTALNNYKRFIETRADIQALLGGGAAYAQGAFELMDKLWELDGCQDNPGITHPKTSDRVAAAKKICSCLQWRYS